MAAQPPGPGLPRQAPSVKISTPESSDIEAVTTRVGDTAVKAQFTQIFEGVLRLEQCPGRLVEPVEEPRQQKAEGAAAGEKRQRAELGRSERPSSPIVVEQHPRLGHVEAAVGFEAPGIEADRQVI